MREKWTTVLAAAAFVVAVFALTPVGNATKSLIAPNADKVDGIHASKKAKALCRSRNGLETAGLNTSRTHLLRLR